MNSVGDPFTGLDRVLQYSNDNNYQQQGQFKVAFKKVEKVGALCAV